MKRCSKCGEWKEESEFSKCQRNKDRLSNRCKGCSHNYYLAYKNVSLEKSREWIKNNPDKRRATVNKHNAKEGTKKRKSEWYQSEKDRLIPAMRERYKINRDRYLALGKLRYENNKPAYAERCKRYSEKNKVKLQIVQHLYYVNNKDRIIARSIQIGHRPEEVAKKYFRKYDIKKPPQELIDLKAEQIRLFRAVRDKKMGVQEHEDGKEREGTRADSVRAHRRPERSEVQEGDHRQGRNYFGADVPASPAGGA